MAGDLKITLRADTSSSSTRKPYWLATASENDSPMWDGSGPTPDMALYALAENLFEELMGEREQHGK